MSRVYMNGSQDEPQRLSTYTELVIDVSISFVQTVACFFVLVMVFYGLMQWPAFKQAFWSFMTLIF